jgi:hypothetical protein
MMIPAGAAAGTKPAERGSGHQTQPEVTESFYLQGTNGFVVAVSFVDHRQLAVSAQAPIGNGAKQAFYTLSSPQSPDSDDIKARIGNLGRVDVRFVPDSTHEFALTISGCKGGKSVIEEGHFVGIISFRGERGYTQARSHHAVGSITRVPARTCSSPKPSAHDEAAAEKAGEKLEEEGGELTLDARVDHGKIEFLATRHQGKSKGRSQTTSSFTVAAIRKRGKIAEVALSQAIVEKGSGFLSPEPLFPTREAMIAPPAPFSGTGTFRRETGRAASWSGDLKVELPGFGTVPLAGNGSHASMCQAPACRL